MRTPGVFMPTLVQKLVRALGRIAPGESGNGIDHPPKIGLGVLDFRERSSESFLRLVSFDGEAGYMSSALDQLQIRTRWSSRWGIADENVAKDFAGVRTRRC